MCMWVWWFILIVRVCRVRAVYITWLGGWGCKCLQGGSVYVYSTPTVVLSRLSGVWDLSLGCISNFWLEPFFLSLIKCYFCWSKKDLLGWVGELVVCMVWTVEKCTCISAAISLSVFAKFSIQIQSWIKLRLTAVVALQLMRWFCMG